jgi:hypothetical protein
LVGFLSVSLRLGAASSSSLGLWEVAIFFLCFPRFRWSARWWHRLDLLRLRLDLLLLLSPHLLLHFAFSFSFDDHPKVKSTPKSQYAFDLDDARVLVHLKTMR